jgi:hypothetical protein
MSGILGGLIGSLVSGTYELIETKILATTTASVTFTNLGDYSTQYKHLQFRVVSRDNRSTTGGNNVLVRLNGDTGANYAAHRLRGDGSTVAVYSSVSQTSMNLFASVSLNDAASVYGPAVLDVLDAYSASKNKTLRSLQGMAISASTSAVELRSGFWNNTSSITSVTLTPETTGSFVSGSRFSLYGIR